MKYQYLLISVFLIVSPVYASCICEDGSQGKTEQELVQEKQDLEIRLHNMSVMNDRAEASLKQEIAEKESVVNEILAKKVLAEISKAQDAIVYDENDNINWQSIKMVDGNVY